MEINPLIMGLTGRARVGKDTVAAYMSDHWGFVPMAFADPIRDGLQTMFGIDRHFLDRDKEVEIPGIGASYRKLAQTLGTEWGRTGIDPMLWVRQMERRIDTGDEQDRIVITDVRFTNEADWIRERGILVHIVRDDAPGVRQHPSENGIERIPGEWVLYNSGSIGDLQHQVDCLMRNIADSQP